MTCEEVVASVSTVQPDSVTRGMRAAVISHILTCKPCREKIDELAAEEEARLGPLPPMDVLKNELTVEEDLRDTEYREMTRAAFAKHKGV